MAGHAPATFAFTPLASSTPLDSPFISPQASPAGSRRGSMHAATHPMASGPRPGPRPDGSDAHTDSPSILSRAGSPTLPLMGEKTKSRSSSFVDGGRSGFALSALSRLNDGSGPRRVGEFVGSIDCGTTSTRFIIFDSYARIIAEHSSPLTTSHPHPGHHSVSPPAIIASIEECVTSACMKLEMMGYDPAQSVKVIGITNMRETTVCWERGTGKVLGRSGGKPKSGRRGSMMSLSRNSSSSRHVTADHLNLEEEPSLDLDKSGEALVWDDTRTVGVVRHFQTKLEHEGLEVEESEEQYMTGEGEKPTLLGAANEMLDKVMTSLGIHAPAETAKEEVASQAVSEKAWKKWKGPDAIVDLTGIPLSTYFSAIKLRWMIDHHADVRKAHDEDSLCFGTVDSWIVYNLTGGAKNGLHIIDVSNASRTLLMNINNLTWSPTLLRFFSIKASCLPTIVSSSEVYGAMASGPLAGVRIAGLIGDQQAALVGNKCLLKGEAKNTYGTGAFVLFNTGDKVVRSKNGLISTVAYQLGNEDGKGKGKAVYALEGSIAVAGSAIKWLRDQIGLIDESSEMDRLCSHVKDTGGVYFVTGFSGLLAPYWDPNATGMIIGLTQYSTSSHIARATLEAVCFQTRAVLDVIEQESGVKLTELKVDGGVTNSDLAMQIQADIGGFRVCRPYMRESTALGSALLAGSAINLFGWDLSQVETLKDVNTAQATIFSPVISERARLKMVAGWAKAVKRAAKWTLEDDLEKEEEEFEKEDGEAPSLDSAKK